MSDSRLKTGIGLEDFLPADGPNGPRFANLDELRVLGVLRSRSELERDSLLRTLAAQFDMPARDVHEVLKLLFEEGRVETSEDFPIPENGGEPEYRVPTVSLTDYGRDYADSVLRQVRLILDLAGVL